MLASRRTFHADLLVHTDLTTTCVVAVPQHGHADTRASNGSGRLIAVPLRQGLRSEIWNAD